MENCWSLQPIIWSFKVVYTHQIRHSVHFLVNNVNCQSPLVPLDPRNVTCLSFREISSKSVQVSLAIWYIAPHILEILITKSVTRQWIGLQIENVNVTVIGDGPPSWWTMVKYLGLATDRKQPAFHDNQTSWHSFNTWQSSSLSKVLNYFDELNRIDQNK